MPQNENTPVLLNKQELMEVLKIAYETLRKLDKAGLPRIELNHKTIRYDLAEVVEWLKTKHGKGNRLSQNATESDVQK